MDSKCIVLCSLEALDLAGPFGRAAITVGGRTTVGMGTEDECGCCGDCTVDGATVDPGKDRSGLASRTL